MIPIPSSRRNGDDAKLVWHHELQELARVRTPRYVSARTCSSSSHALPAVLPVQNYVDDGTIVICLGGFRLPRRAVHEVVVAFSVDHIDPDTWFGWAVHAVGRSNFKYRDDGAPAECDQTPPGQLVQLQPTIFTGQQLQVCPFLPAVG